MDWIILKRFSQYFCSFIDAFRVSFTSPTRTSSVQSTLIGQEFISGKTTFVFKQQHQYIRRTAQSLYKDTVLLGSFSHQDLIIIISTAVLEQAMDDFLGQECG